MNASSEPIRIGSGSTIEAHPASQQPRMIVMSDREVGPRIATWSPGTRPRACSAAPTTRASSWISAHDTNPSPSAGATEWPTNRTPVGRSAAAIRRSTIERGAMGAASAVMKRNRSAAQEVRRIQRPMSSTSDSTTSEPQHAFRYTGALAQEIEPRWQDWWDEHGTFHTANPSGPLGDASVKDQPKLFVLDMFPYPSGTGLHVGHPLGFIGTDVYSRFKRMTGHNVLYTMGFDAFGLPAEQFAVQTGQHPAVTTAENVANMRRQLRRIGLSHDPRRSIDTTDPAYYRWTQWIFSQIFNAWYDTDRKTARPISELVDEFAAGTRATPDGVPGPS
jgi:hypothetical protein